MANKVYIGDAVYADVDNDGRLVLTTENGLQATNRIILEPEVLGQLMEYVKSYINAGFLIFH